MLEFHEITLDMLPAIYKIVDDADCKGSQYSTYNLFCLQQKYKTMACIYNETLFVRQYNRDFGNFAVYLTPIGKLDLRLAIDIVCKNAYEEGKRAFFFAALQQDIQLFSNRFIVTENRDWADYIYYTKDMATLADKSLTRRLADFHKFEEIHKGFCVETINSSNLSEVIEFQSKWYDANINQNPNVHSLEQEYAAIKTGFENWVQLQLRGVCIRIDCNVVAYNYGVGLTHKVFVSHAQKCSRQYPYIYSAIDKFFNQQIFNEYEFINKEEDIGHLGLRDAKLKYHPCQLLMKYNVYDSW